MRLLTPLGFLVLAISCSTPKATVAPLAAPTKTVSFYAVDDPNEAPTGRARDFVAGVVQLGAVESRVLITERLIRGGTNERPEQIQAGLANGDLASRNWHEGQLGPTRSVVPLSHSPADTLRDTLVLVLPVRATDQLNDQWLFFKVWGTVRMPGTSDWRRAYRSLHSRVGVFRE